MATPPVPDSLLQDAVDLVAKYGTPHLASKFGNVPDGTLRNRLRLAKEKGITSDCQFPDGMRLSGTSTLLNSKGEAVAQWVKTKEDRDQHEARIRAMAEELKSGLPKVKPRKSPKDYNKKLMSVIPWGDPHFGLYVWSEECGEDFDLDIAKRDLCNAVDYLVSQSPASERCVLINLGDFFHSDNNQGTTTRGTRMDTDTRLAKVVRVGVCAIRYAIEKALTRHKTVEIINAIGNHDEVLSMALSILLSHVYEKEPRVIVHDQPTRRHYLRHGKVLIGVTHGDKQKEDKLPGIMATEKPQDWGETVYRYFYKGHLHHDRRIEFNGCIVEMVRTLAMTDEYASSLGLLSMQDMKLICMHSDYGEVSRVTCSINLLRDLQCNSPKK